MGMYGASATVSNEYTKGGKDASQTMFNALSQDILNKFTEMAFANYSANTAKAATTYSKEAALADTQGLVSSFMRQLTEQQLPALVNAEAGGGAYGSTATAALKNDAVARTAEATARAQLEGIAQYANISQAMQGTELGALAQALGLQKGANVQTSEDFWSNVFKTSATAEVGSPF